VVEGVSWRNPPARFRQLLHLAAAAVLLTALPANAQRAERPDVAVGDRWNFVVYYTVPSRVPNRSWIVTSVDDDRVVGTENGEPLTLSRELNIVDAPLQSESNQRLLQFPLEVGRRWQYTSEWLFKPKGSRGTLAVDVAVAGYESIEVPAGRFDAFKLLAVGELGGSAPSGTFFAGKTSTTIWYAPAARAIVKSIHFNPYQGTTTVELTGFQLQH
jgi:hypothetical protein